MVHEHLGGCHCGRVRFRVLVRQLDVYECNCSVCRKKGLLHLFVPPADFELLCGEESLVDYRFNTKVARHRFCAKCGVQSFYIARSHPNHIDVNVRCFDQDVLADIDVIPFDGRNWEQSIHELREEPNG